MWNMLKGVKKFTPKSELDKIIGTPLFQLENRPVYYYGNGIAVYFSSQCFRVEGIQRVEYGALGEYAVGIYHFSDVTALKTGFSVREKSIRVSKAVGSMEQSDGWSPTRYTI